MSNMAFFHRLGSLGCSDAYLEKYSRSLVCLGGQEAQCLVQDCDREVMVSDAVWHFLSSARAAQKILCPRCEPGLSKDFGVELTIIVTENCNFSCRYCFADKLYSGTKTLEAGHIINHIRKFLMLSCSRVSSLIFFGGEPLLAFNEIKKSLKIIKSLFIDHQGTIPSFAIVTNGSLITREIANFFVDEDIVVTVSLDGPKRIHDACRPLRRGEPSYEMVVEGINELFSVDAYYAIEATYTSQHLDAGIDVIDVVDHALEFGAQEVHVMPAFPERMSGIDTADNAHVARLFKVAAERATSRYLESGAGELAYASRLAYAFAHDRKRRFICTAGLDKFTVMANGDVVPCYLLCDSAYRFVSCGQADQAGMDKFLAAGASMCHGLAREQLPGCSQCWASDWCFACYGPGYARHGFLGAPGGLECDIYRAITEATLLECARFLSARQVERRAREQNRSVRCREKGRD